MQWICPNCCIHSLWMTMLLPCIWWRTRRFLHYSGCGTVYISPEKKKKNQTQRPPGVHLFSFKFGRQIPTKNNIERMPTAILTILGRKHWTQEYSGPSIEARSCIRHCCEMNVPILSFSSKPHKKTRGFWLVERKVKHYQNTKLNN